MSEQPHGQMFFRAASDLLGVSFPERVIELVVVPYDTDALVDQPYGRPVLESVAPGAFDGIERRANRVRVNRDHELQRTVGRAVALHPSRQEGLVAEIKIAKTDLGDETLQLADDGCLDASAAFLPMPGGMTWARDRKRVTLTKLWLSHVAMTPDPAYETARVLAVRNSITGVAVPDGERVATPNLDTIYAWRLEERYAQIVR